MREIKFRGKLIDKDVWVYGYLHIYKNDSHPIGGPCNRAWILETNNPDYSGWSLSDTYFPNAVDPKTVGQYTGLKDRNEKDSYGDDIVHVEMDQLFGGVEKVGVIEYSENSAIWTILFPNDGVSVGLGSVEEFEIIGNIHENAELLTP